MKTYLSLLFVLTLSLFTFTAHAGFEGKAAGSSLKLFQAVNCDTGLVCTRTKGGVFNIKGGGSGNLHNQVAATATTIKSSQCGSTFYNTGAVTILLPVASTTIGCRLTFVTANASSFVVDPDAASQILVNTNALGDSIVNATLGNTITLQALSATQWVVISNVGTWTDNN